MMFHKSQEEEEEKREVSREKKFKIIQNDDDEKKKKKQNKEKEDDAENDVKKRRGGVTEGEKKSDGLVRAEEEMEERVAKRTKTEDVVVVKGLTERLGEGVGGVLGRGAAVSLRSAETRSEREVDDDDDDDDEDDERQPKVDVAIDCVDNAREGRPLSTSSPVPVASSKETRAEAPRKKDELNESFQNGTRTPLPPTTTTSKKETKGDDNDDEENADGNTTSNSNKKTRQSKSLSLLCERFLDLYSSGYENLISLDEVCSTLGVERRRIYDIVNVLEAVEVVVKKGKNQYAWFGISRLPSAIEKIEKFGAESFDIKLPEQLSLQVSEHSLPFQSNGKDAVDGVKTAADVGADPAHATNKAKTTAAGKKETSERREKSLSLMTQKFITLFMEAEDGVLGLEDAAAAMLMSEGNTGPKATKDFNDSELKKKIRRLYDIANILSSLRLLSKIHLMDSRKPAFRWMRAEDTVRKLIATGKEHEWFGTTPKSPNSKVQIVSTPKKDGVSEDAAKGALATETMPRLLPSAITASGRKDKQIFAALERMESLLQAQAQDLSAKSAAQAKGADGPKKIPEMFLTTANLFGAGKSFQSKTGDGIFNQYINNFTQNMRQ
jgi:hypothetical protein